MKVPFHNTTDKPIYKGPVLIQPGESRDVDELYVDAVESTEESLAEPSNIETIQGLSIAKATAEFGTLTDNELDELEELEMDQENPRDGLINAITVERLARESAIQSDGADEADEADNK